MTSSPPTRPLDIPTRRARSGSESSESSADMAETPGRSPSGSPPRVKIQTTPGMPTSPVMSFFFPGSPTKTPGSLFARPPPVASNAITDDDDNEPAAGVLPASAHARRFSTSWAKPVPISPPVDDRGAGLLRRLSLSSAFGRPVFPGTHAGGTTPPNTSPVVAKTVNIQAKRPSPSPSPVPGRMRRSATIAVPNPSPPRARAPSPMGERILKGHFDGFV